MNNKVASMVRDFGMSRVFDGMDFSEMIQIDSGKFVFPVEVEENMFWCEVDFVAKKEDYNPDRDIRLYAEKVEKARINAEAKAQKRAEKSSKTKTAKTE